MKKWLKSPSGISIGTAIFSFLLTVGYDLLKNKPVLSTIWGILKAMWRLILMFLNFNLKVWWVILGVVFIVFLQYIIFVFFDDKEQANPEFLNYKEDKFQNWKWSWDWEFNSFDRKWHISRLEAHCPKCDTRMMRESFIDYECPRCNFRSAYGKYDDKNKVERVILDNIRRESFSKG